MHCMSVRLLSVSEGLCVCFFLILVCVVFMFLFLASSVGSHFYMYISFVMFVVVLFGLHRWLCDRNGSGE